MSMAPEHSQETQEALSYAMRLMRELLFNNIPRHVLHLSHTWFHFHDFLREYTLMENCTLQRTSVAQ